ncbi:MAG: SRPBCC family protein [Desulfatibacillaceae bacterium]|nr:SRPBCC family protein [Desulfatibacillaceae bacterium]
MAVEMTIDFTKEMEFNADFDTCFAFFSDVPKTAEYFPKVEKLSDLGGNSFQWEMDKVGVSKYTLQVIYACKYEADKEKGIIKWTPVEGVGNGRNQGYAKLTDENGKTRVQFYTKLDLNLPVPGLIKSLVKPLVVREFNSTADQFEKNLVAKFG